MSISIYQLKPRFQQLLRPFLKLLTRIGVTPNQVTLAAMMLSLGYGAALALTPQWLGLWLGLPFFLLLRMALNAIDGMLANATGNKTALGALLNELCDQVSDVALYLPAALLAVVSSQLVVLVGLGPGQAPDLQLRLCVGVLFAHAQLATRLWSELGGFEVGRCDLVRREEPGGIKHAENGEREEDASGRYEPDPARLAARHARQNASLELPRRRFLHARKIRQAFVGEAEVADLDPALRAGFEVILDLTLFVRLKGAHHVRPEEVSELRVLSHPPLTRSPPPAWSRAARAARRSCGS